MTPRCSLEGLCEQTLVMLPACLTMVKNDGCLRTWAGLAEPEVLSLLSCDRLLLQPSAGDSGTRHVQVLWWATKADTAPKPEVFSRPWEMRFPYKQEWKCTTCASFASLTWSVGPGGSPRPTPTGLHPAERTADCPSLTSWPCWRGEEARG